MASGSLVGVSEPSPRPDQSNTDELGQTGSSGLAITRQEFETVSAWLDRQGESQARTAVRILLERAVRGPGMTEMQPLGAMVRDRIGGHAEITLRAAKLERWLSERAGDLERACREAGLERTGTLRSNNSRGGNPGALAFEMVPIVTCIAAPEADDEEGVVYRCSPVRPTLWLRPLLGRPIETAGLSARAVGFIVITPLMLIALVAGLLSQAKVTWIAAASAGVLAAALVSYLRTVTKAVRQRIAIAPESWLAMDEYFGQLRHERVAGARAGVRISLVRYSADCTVCSGAVELDEGRKDFPGRIVGRCRDAPLEHVFSFDPVTAKGRYIR